MFQDHLASKSMDVEDSMHTFSGDISFVYIHLIILQNGGNANTRFTIPRLLAFGRKPQDSFFLWSQLPANRCVCASIFSVEQTDKGCFLILLSQTFSPDTGHVQQEISALWVVCLQRLLLRESNKNTCFFFNSGSFKKCHESPPFDRPFLKVMEVPFQRNLAPCKNILSKTWLYLSHKWIALKKY